MFKVKNRSSEVAKAIVCAMSNGNNQGFIVGDFSGDSEPLTTRERYDAAQSVLDETGIKIGLSFIDEKHPKYHDVVPVYSWETI